MKSGKMIKKLYDAMVANHFQNLEISLGQVSCRLVAFPHDPTDPSAVLPEMGAAEVGSDDLEVPQDSEKSLADKLVKVIAERVGVFYSGSNPVSAGQSVLLGNVLGTIRGISFEYHINAPVDGRVVSIHINEGEIIEYGRMLFCLERETNE